MDSAEGHLRLARQEERIDELCDLLYFGVVGRTDRQLFYLEQGAVDRGEDLQVLASVFLKQFQFLRGGKLPSWSRLPQRYEHVQ